MKVRKKMSKLTYSEIADKLAEKEYGKDIEDLSLAVQSELYEKAISEVFDRDENRADRLKEERWMALMDKHEEDEKEIGEQDPS